MRCYNLAAALILLSQASGTQAELEIWLASTLNCNSCACNSCAIFSEVAQRRGYGDVLRYDHSGTELDIPIRQVDKRDLDTAILGQLSDGDGPHGPWWDVTLLVLMVDHGHVLAAGNIAQSADVRELRHEPEVMFPPDVPPEGHPSLSEESLYHPFFVREWNLEHFVRIALGSEPKVRSRRASLARDHPPPDPMTPERLIDLTAGDPVAMRPANVILWGSADKPLSNALFISRRIAEIRSTLKALRLDGVQFLTMYGHGPRVPGNDTSYLEDGRVRFQRADLAADLSASGTSMNRVLTGIGESRRSRTLLIQVGHSGPAGSPLWGGGSTLMPGDIAPIRQNPDADLVMISGGCHSGLFAPAVQCGFFAAHPEVKAAGCQLSAQALETSDDYLRHYFAAVRQDSQATLSDAHWFASARLEDHQISYTTEDALIDNYFAAHPDRLPEVMTIGELLDSASVLTTPQRRALRHLAAGYPRETTINLSGYVALNQAADQRLEDATELPSGERNRIAAMPYALVLPILARHVAHRSLELHDPAFESAARCGGQSVASFLQVDPSAATYGP